MNFDPERVLAAGPRRSGGAGWRPLSVGMSREESLGALGVRSKKGETGDGESAAGGDTVLHAMPVVIACAWMAQELLTTFEAELGEVALAPGTGGVFEVRVNDEIIWSRKAEGRFPESKELKQRVRDHVAPDKPLGHSDKK